jgi:short-subunit dehydrogenase
LSHVPADVAGTGGTQPRWIHHQRGQFRRTERNAGHLRLRYTKAGVVALSEHLRTEWADTGIGVSVVCPAFVKTNLLDDFRGGHSGFRDMVQRWMEKSGVTADDVAREVMLAMQQRRFLVLTHGPTRRAWLLKRFWPERYYREVARQGIRMRSKVA